MESNLKNKNKNINLCRNVFLIELIILKEYQASLEAVH
jgi:hypothetical protein